MHNGLLLVLANAQRSEVRVRVAFAGVLGLSGTGVSLDRFLKANARCAYRRMTPLVSLGISPDPFSKDSFMANPALLAAVSLLFHSPVCVAAEIAIDTLSLMIGQ